ncbi:alcohol dehydrogenase class IV [Tepidamorphus gemmatus]|uniref:Alcohol dehydrogenase class IV n=1 Tax=Tepidamorphus gemmatus TaxID=747076 RepID=A0A4R3M606_9HYPH|nr:iron-containing alcohol dehydrogenase [Tepidamorphus gemmatus]TCT08740.1 alcohol dehydrogenase class IV [Tepidamorphus gemmatus]
MSSYSLGRVPAIAAGPGRIDGLGADVSLQTGGTATVLLVADPALAGLGITGRAEAVLSAAGHAVHRFEDVVSDPRETQVIDGAGLARRIRADAIVALGGGSALDAAKMIAVLAATDRPIAEFRLAAAPLPARTARLLCVPTTAGTGSETTAVAVLTSPEHAKIWYWGGPLKPDAVVLDPELTVALPPALTAATGLDALVHAMEAATNRNRTDVTDLYALETIRLAIRHLPAAVARPGDLDARMGMLTAACLAGTAIDNAGTALAHNIGHALGSLMPVHHGKAVALAMEASLPFVIEGNRAAFARVAEAFGIGPDPDGLPARFTAFIDELGLDRHLPEVPDPALLAARMAAPENAAMRASTVREVRDEDLARLAALTLARAGMTGPAS